jgi:hypothetical protein
MNSLFTRSALEFWSGGTVAKDVHHVWFDHFGKHVVTYAEHMEVKRQHQAKTLELCERVTPWRAWRFRVIWSPGIGREGFFRGWHAYLDRPGETQWVRYPNAALLRLFSLLVPVDDAHWYEWKRVFVLAYQRGRQNGRPRGCDRAIELLEAKEAAHAG